MNNKFLLSQLDISSDYTITGHGIIQPKKDASHSDKPVGGEGSDDAVNDDDEEEEAAPDDPGDNGVPHAPTAKTTDGKGRGKTNGPDKSKSKPNDQSTTKKTGQKNSGSKQQQQPRDDSASRKTRSGKK